MVQLQQRQLRLWNNNDDDDDNYDDYSSTTKRI